MKAAEMVNPGHVVHLSRQAEGEASYQSLFAAQH
jgi:hypothetical protein